MMWRSATGAGQSAFTIECSGAVIRNGSSEPALFGISGAMAHFSA